jgi:RNA polymerase sigma-70 factor (ECF subfamily)
MPATPSSATSAFEDNRRGLMSLAYQMLGEIQAAEDIVQEAWLRWSDADQAAIRSPKAWLSSVVTRLAIDQLRSARHKREVYTGPWLPEAVMEIGPGPSRALELAQECELAMLWSLERLAEEERAAFLLNQVFDTPYADIAVMLERSEQSCRQLVSRAKKRLAQAAPRFDPSAEKLEQVMLDFAAAAAAGNREEVMRMLAPDVVSLSDGGGIVTAAIIPLHGPARVAQVLTHVAQKRGILEGVEITSVNGRPALVRLLGDENDMIFTVRLNRQGQICWIYTLRNPEKLAAVKPGYAQRPG